MTDRDTINAQAQTIMELQDLVYSQPNNEYVEALEMNVTELQHIIGELQQTIRRMKGGRNVENNQNNV